MTTQTQTTTIDRQTLARVNRRMEHLVADDRLGAFDLGPALAAIWQPLANALARYEPADMHAEYAESLGGDYVGALPTGEVVEWGPDRPTGRGFSFRSFLIEP